MKPNRSNSIIQDSSHVNLNFSKQKFEQKPNFSPIDELNLLLDTKNPHQDEEELNNILTILNYPSTQIAEWHGEAIKLGNLDLEQESRKAQESLKISSISSIEKVKLCPCCGFKRQQQNITICTQIDQVSNLGTSTVLYFQTIKNLSILLVVLACVFSLYSLATNIIAAKNNSLGSKYTVDYLTISLSSKQSNDTTNNRFFYYIQAWLGVATVLIWILIFILNRLREFKQAYQYDHDTISASDYTIIMNNMPLDITKDQLQKSLNAYYQRINSARTIPQNRKRPLKIVKLNVAQPFYLDDDQFKDQELQKTIQQIEESKQIFRDWIKQRQSKNSFTVQKSKRQQQYRKYSEKLKRKDELSKQLKQKIEIKLRDNNTDQLTSIFVTFDTNIAPNFIIHFNQESIFNIITSFIVGQNNYFLEREDKRFKPIILRAPQPEDIVWENIGRSECNKFVRKLLIYTITGILLGICFGVVYVLSRVQQDNGNDRIISIFISIVIAIINIVLGQVIRVLTFIEKDYTTTNRQASLAVKSIVAQMINSILIPVITAYYIKTSTGVYQQGGLVDNIFMMGISNSLLSPVLLLFDFSVIKVAVFRFLKTRSLSKLYQTQKEHNSYFEGLQFQVGFQYIYLVNLFMFVCFFVSLQPILPFFALIGFLLTFWVQKYCLFNRYKRPVPGTNFINQAVYQMIFFCPLIYSLGSLTWANFDPKGIPPEALVPNLISLSFSILLIALPIDKIIFSCCLDDNAVVNATSYEENRIFFPSEYDRSNPATASEGLEDHKKFMEKINIQLSKKSKEEQEEINKKRMVQIQRGMLNEQNKMNQFGNMIPQFPNQPLINGAIQGQKKGYLPVQPIISSVQMGNSPFSPKKSRN